VEKSRGAVEDDWVRGGGDAGVERSSLLSRKMQAQGKYGEKGKRDWGS